MPTTYFDVPDMEGLTSITKEYVVATAEGSDHASHEALSRLLRRVRQAFQMDCVFVSEFLEGRRIFRHVDSADEENPIVSAGGSDPLEESFCQRVVDGRLPMAMPDAAANAVAGGLPVTQKIGLGAHLSVPIYLPDGSVFGTLCCFSKKVQPGLGGSEVNALAAVANLIASSLCRDGAKSDAPAAHGRGH
ncbi:MAG: GAF domain-containing protein [Burkholderiaceae bacterium]|nr:GAF domain-containing protein [Burkholderiaceae bacterium]MDP1968265.1 GAF domain-containing protein [Burkholderiaceae bacterium]